VVDCLLGRRRVKTPTPRSDGPVWRAMRGLAASPGETAGPALVLREPGEASRFAAPGFILVVHSALPEWAILLDRAVGVVAETGGVTSHLASIARELAIPCVVAVHAATQEIPNGACIRVSGTTGIVLVCTDPGVPSSG
jgi:pyruvate,water dikinase